MTLIDFSKYLPGNRKPPKEKVQLPPHPILPPKEKETINSLGSSFVKPKLRQQDINVNKFFKKYANKNLTSKDILEIGLGPLDPKVATVLINAGAKASGVKIHEIKGGKERVNALNVIKKISSNNDKVNEFIGNAARMFPRTVIGGMLSVLGDKEFSTQKLGKPAELFFGKEPIETFPTRIRKTSEGIKKIVGTDKVGPIGNIILPTLGVGASITLDLFDPFFGSLSEAPSKITNKIIKKIAEQTGESISKKLEKEISKDVVKILSKKGLSDKSKKIIVKNFEKKYLRKLQEESVDVLEKQRLPEKINKINEIINKEKNKIKEEVLKNSKFAERVNPRLPEDFRLKLKTKPLSNLKTLKDAKKLVKNNIEEALQLAKTPNPTAESNTVAQILIDKFIKEKRFDTAIELIEQISTQATKYGQAIQALRNWSRLSPEAFLKLAQKNISEANRLRKNLNLKLSQDVAEKIVEMTKKMNKLPEGRAKDVSVAQILDKIAEQIPPTIWEKVSSIQTMAQLINPKTAIRNIGGNTIFAIAENVSQTLGAGFDKVLSKLLKSERTVGLPSLKTQLKEGRRGFSLGLEDALLGIDTSGLSTRFDFGKKKIWRGKTLNQIEKIMNIELRATDRAFYYSAYGDSLREQMQLAKTTIPTDQMKELAHYEGLYRTFQDDNIISKAFSKIKQGLNGSKDFGLGDLLIKYPRTPGALIARGIEYSPVGYINALFQIAKPLFGRGTFNQRAFVQAFSRASVGSFGFMGTGIILHRLGIVTGELEDDKDFKNLQKSIGLGQYRINTTALKRYILSGFNESEAKRKAGDLMVSYDWAQPMSIPFAMGAAIDDSNNNKEDVAITLASSIAQGSQTLAEQPLVQGLVGAFQFKDIPGALTDVASKSASSFIPTLLGQIKLITDNNKRAIYDKNPIKYGANLVLNKLPGLSRTLPEVKNVFGESQEIYDPKQSSNKIFNGLVNIFNVFFNPAFVSKYNPTPESDMVLSIYQSTGLLTQLPRVVKNNFRMYSQTLKLNADQVARLQEVTGKMTTKIFSKLATNEEFLALPPDIQAEELGRLLTKIGTKSKEVFLEELINKFGIQGLQGLQDLKQ